MNLELTANSAQTSPVFTIDKSKLSPAATENLDRLSSLGQKLSTKEDEVFMLISKALTNKDIAKQQGVAAKTVEKHVSAALHKLKIPRALAPLVALLTGKLDLNALLEGLKLSGKTASS